MSDDRYRQEVTRPRQAMETRVAELEAALAPVAADIERQYTQRLEESGWNPDSKLTIFLTVAECRAIREVAKGKS